MSETSTWADSVSRDAERLARLRTSKWRYRTERRARARASLAAAFANEPRLVRPCLVGRRCSGVGADNAAL